MIFPCITTSHNLHLLACLQQKQPTCGFGKWGLFQWEAQRAVWKDASLCKHTLLRLSGSAQTRSPTGEVHEKTCLKTVKVGPMFKTGTFCQGFDPKASGNMSTIIYRLLSRMKNACDIWPKPFQSYTGICPSIDPLVHAKQKHHLASHASDTHVKAVESSSQGMPNILPKNTARIEQWQG